MFNFNLKVALFALIVPITGICQSMSYEDADSPGEAVGMMKHSERAALVMREQCIARFPSLQAEIDTNLLKWKTAEAEVLKKTELHWAAMVKKQPSMSDALNLVDSTIKIQMETASKLPDQAGSDILLQRCKKHFSDLAAGMWRKRTPRAYAFMDQAT